MKFSNLQLRHFFLISTVVTAICFEACIKKRHTAATLHSNWMSSNPLTIPYRVRLQKKELGNLLENAGFEQGKFFYFDTVPQATFDINGWKKVGSNVFWVDITNPGQFDSSEVSEGSHAIKIHRPVANETEDTGEGLISDFIKVIPGNYQLSLNIKLKNVHSHKARLGTKIYNAIDIRLLYYDKNKLEINSNIYSPHYQTNINTSFKGYPFSNFWSIDSIGWTRVFCKTANYPFPEGNIPDETRFVKVFLGFKGEGTMWVDNVELRYTDYNFSIKELTEPYANKSFDSPELLIPNPKKLEKIGTLDLTDSSQVLIISPASYKNLADSLAQQFSKLCNTEILNAGSDFRIADYSGIISIGPTSFYQKHSDAEICKEEGDHQKSRYRIQIKNAGAPLILINATTDEGIYHGVNRMYQLIDLPNNRLHLVNIHDWPTFENRGFIVKDTVTRYKQCLNGLFTNMLVVKSLENEEQLPGFINLGHIITMNHNENERFQMDKFITFNDNFSNNEKYYNPYLPVSKASAKGLNSSLERENLILYNDWNHVEFLDMYFDKFDSYYRYSEIFYSRSLAFSWSGSSQFSYYIDETSYARYINYVKRPVQFIDKTLSDNRPLFTGNTSLFLAPVYRTQLSASMIDSLNSILFELPTVNPFSRISALTAADFSWNPQHYDPWLSLNKALVSEYGKENTALLLTFNDNYIKFSQLLNGLTNDQLNNRLLKTFEDHLSQMHGLIEGMDLPEAEMNYLLKLHAELQREMKTLFANTKFVPTNSEG